MKPLHVVALAPLITTSTSVRARGDDAHGGKAGPAAKEQMARGIASEGDYGCLIAGRCGAGMVGRLKMAAR